MSISISVSNKEDFVNTLSEEIRNDIMISVEAALHDADLEGDAYQTAWDRAFNSKVSDLEDTIDIDYVDEKLTFYVVENLRYQQDNTGGFKIERFEKLEDAIRAFSSLPQNYTSALGGVLGTGEIDFIHRKNGDAVQVNDFKFIDRWDNPLVHRAIDAMNSRLGVEYESDLRIFGGHSVLLPLQGAESKHLNSYFVDKYLRPSEDAVYEVSKRYGDLSMYAPDNRIHSLYLQSAVNEVFVGGRGWMKAEAFFKKLESIDEYASPERLKVMNLNVNYVDLNGRTGQADISPHQFSLLKKQTIEKTAQHPDIDVQISEADKIRTEQIEQKNRNRTKHKERDEEYR